MITGYYIYIKISAPRVNGDIAKLIYPNFTGSVCQRFVRKLNGENAGSLRIKVNGTTVFSKSVNEKHFWYHTAIEITGRNVKVSAPFCFSKCSSHKKKKNYIYCVMFCIVLYCIVLQCIVLYNILYCIVLHCIVFYYIVLYCITLYCIVLYCVVLYYIALYCIVLYYVVLNSIVLCIFTSQVIFCELLLSYLSRLRRHVNRPARHRGGDNTIGSFQV